jgi:hypothetical protein
MQQAKKLIGFVFRLFLPAAWSLACFLHIPLALLDRICFEQLLPGALNFAGEIFRQHATGKTLVVLTPVKLITLTES